MHGIRLIYEIAIIGVLRSIFDLYWQDNFLTNKIQSDKDNFLDNLIYEIAIIGVLGSIFRQDNFLTIYERFWHLGGRVHRKAFVDVMVGKRIKRSLSECCEGECTRHDHPYLDYK